MALQLIQSYYLWRLRRAEERVKGCQSLVNRLFSEANIPNSPPEVTAFYWATCLNLERENAKLDRIKEKCFRRGYLQIGQGS